MARLSEQWLECRVCQNRMDVNLSLTGCPRCAANGKKAPLEVRYDYEKVNLRRKSQAPGLWRWSALLPRVASRDPVSLSEGNTPLPRIRCAGPRLLLKNETANPTWSFKDRPNCVSVSAARAFGFKNVFAISTGNHGNATSAYAAAAGLRCVVFCHSDAPDLQLALMRHFGSSVVRGGDQAALTRALVARGDWFPCSTFCPRDGYANPFGVEGIKTMAFEIFEQLGNKVPDRVFVPVGSGDGLFGLWKGFVELRKTGLADRAPRMYACQAAGANPFVRSFRQGLRRVEAIPHADTIALSIGEKVGGDAALLALYESGGGALEVDDAEITVTAKALAREGFAIEPASATAVACARNEASASLGDETWVTIGTGATVKWPHTVTAGFTRPGALPEDFGDADDLLERLQHEST